MCFNSNNTAVEPAPFSASQDDTFGIHCHCCMPENPKHKAISILRNDNCKQWNHNARKQIEDNIWNFRLRWYYRNCKKQFFYMYVKQYTCYSTSSLPNLHSTGLYTSNMHVPTSHSLSLWLIVYSLRIITFHIIIPSACTLLNVYLGVPTQHRVPETLRSVLRHSSKAWLN